MQSYASSFHSENHAARRGLSFNDAASEGKINHPIGSCFLLNEVESLTGRDCYILRSTLFFKLLVVYNNFQHSFSGQEFPNSVPDSALPITGGMSSAFKPVPKGLQTRPALRDRTVPHEEPCSTAVNTSNHSNRVPVTMTTEMQHSYPALPPNNNIFNTLNQQSAFHQVTPGSKGLVDAFGRHTPGSHTPGSIDNYYPSPTVNTKAAQEAVLAMFNNPLGVDSNEDLPWMNRQQVPGPDKDFEAAFRNDNRTENIGTGPFGMQGKLVCYSALL